MKLAMGHYINICMIEILEPHHKGCRVYWKVQNSMFWYSFVDIISLLYNSDFSCKFDISFRNEDIQRFCEIIQWSLQWMFESSNFFLQPCCSVAIKICVLYRSYQIKLQFLFFECQIAKVYMPKLKLEGMFYQIILQAR